MQTIKVYSKPVDSVPKCYACENTKRKLDSAGLEYEVFNLEEDAHLEYAKSLGHQQAPVVVVTKDDGTEDHWSGFRPDKVLEYSK